MSEYVGKHRATVELPASRMFTTFYVGKHRVKYTNRDHNHGITKRVL